MLLPSTRIAVFTLLGLFCCLLARAQEPGWKELDDQAGALAGQGKTAEAIPIAVQALKAAETAFGPDDPRLATALRHLGKLYDNHGDYANAEPMYVQALGIEEKVLGSDDPGLAGILFDLAALYDDMGRYAESEPLYQRTIGIDEKAHGSDSPDVADDLSALAELYVHMGKYAQAEPLYQRALGIQEKALGTEAAEVAKTVNNLALLYFAQGKYTQAEPLFLRAMALEEKTNGPDDPDLAGILSNLGVLYGHLGKYAEEEPLLQRALQIDEKTFGPDHPNVAIDLGNLAVLYGNQGRYTEAEPAIARSLAIFEKALGPDHPKVGMTMNNLAQVYTLLGKYAEAEPLYQRGLRIQEKALGPDHPDVAMTLNHIAQLYDYEGKYAHAEPLILRAIRIDEKALGPDHEAVADDLTNLTFLYSHQGKYAEAEPVAQRALAILEKAVGLDHASVALALNNLALLYLMEGSYAKAEPLYRRALGIQEKALGPEHVDVALTLNNLARLYAQEGRYAEAEPLYQRALAINEKVRGPDNTEVAKNLTNLADLYTTQGRYSEAEPLYQRALAINKKAFGPDNPDVATDLNNLGGLYYHEGKYDEALGLMQQGLAAWEKAFGANHPDVAKALFSLAAVYDAQSKFAQAESNYQRAFDNLFDQFQYNFTYMTEKERLSFLDTIAGIFPVYFSFVHRFRQQDPALIGAMYNLLLWQKGFIAGSIADMRRRVEASSDAEALNLLNQLTAKRTQLAALLSTNPADRALWRQQVDQLKTESDDIEKALVARSSAFAEQKKLDRATWQQVRDALKPGEAAVEFARFDFYDTRPTGAVYYVALVVTQDTKTQPDYIILGDGKQIEGDAFSSLQRATQTRGFEQQSQTATLPGAAAYEQIWKPLEGALAATTRLYISPDGVLNQIPLGIIPAPGGRLLMETYDLRLVSSTKDILRAEPSPSTKTALLLGDPTFDLTEDAQLAATKKLQLPQQPEIMQLAALSPDDHSRDLATGGKTLPPLPGTGLEVSSIAKLMDGTGWKTTVYMRDLALKRVVEQAASPRVLHLATHGFFLPDQTAQQFQPGGAGPAGKLPPGSGNPELEDPMLRSGLYFAGADRALAGLPSPAETDNGVLTALEAGNLNLTGTELVVMSACNTGQGDVRNGEGVFGLRRALQEAGAQSVMMSLWSVPDKETLELMQLFYAKWLAGTEKHEALKEAQLEMREKVRQAHGGHDLPYYWGAFVLVGR